MCRVSNRIRIQCIVATAPQNDGAAKTGTDSNAIFLMRLTHADLVQRVDTHTITTSHNQVMAVNTTTMTTDLRTSLLDQSVQLVTACQTVRLVIAVLSHTQAES